MKTFGKIVCLLGHKKIDVIKMDIEGSEIDVLDFILDSKVEVKQLLIAFHHRFSKKNLSESKKIIKKIKSKGYKIVGVSSSLEEFTFLKKGIKYENSSC
jgi:3-dehydroquinate dehydratase